MTKLTTHLLPPEQYGGRQGYCATDAVLELVQRIETSKEKISAMLIDIQGAFDNVNRNILADTMEDMKLPKALINWTYQFMRKCNLLLPNGELREPQKEVKLLGITLNNLLDFKSHILNKINKARKAVGAIWHLGGVQKGMRGSAVRSLYIACVRPIVEYGLEIWHHKILKGEIHKLEVMQNMALRRIVGAYRTTPIAVLQKEVGIMPYSIRLKFMVARKAIRLHLNISKTNPINGHLLTLIEKSPIAKLTTLYMLAKR
ncbi:uncharacterized protein SAPINGB_P006330 [Magnusiomyces paraingens]|uniref:Uncharacterized protein n=1 Tax=Magnusiomyces paraingens TaxID=2606893 RepID=A0A5E8C6J9_9ASCO|nr:uncharacterized protein SAPINGB_P006330 [Saprochaete ingens]VVT58680.1 unnamed protein product [Saprochaete ingens]